MVHRSHWESAFFVTSLLFVTLWSAFSCSTKSEIVNEVRREFILESAGAKEKAREKDNENKTIPDMRGDLDETFSDAALEKRVEQVPEKRVYKVSVLGNYISGGHGVAVDAKENLYFSDTYGRHRVGVKAVYRLAPPYRSPPEQLSLPVSFPGGLEWREGYLYVCDLQKNQVMKFDEKLQLVESFQATSPWNLSMTKSGELYTVSYAGMVQKLNKGQAPTSLFGGLQNPFDLHVLENGHIWLSEQGPSGTEPGQVTLRDQKGNIKKQFSYNWSNPEGLAVDDEGGVWVADTGAGKLVRGDENGSVVIAAGLDLPVNLNVFVNGDMLLASVGGTQGIPKVYRVSR